MNTITKFITSVASATVVATVGMVPLASAQGSDMPFSQNPSGNQWIRQYGVSFGSQNQNSGQQVVNDVVVGNQTTTPTSTGGSWNGSGGNGGNWGGGGQDFHHHHHDDDSLINANVDLDVGVTRHHHGSLIDLDLGLGVL